MLFKDYYFIEKITLNQLYKDNMPDNDEIIWDYGLRNFDIPLNIEEREIKNLLNFKGDKIIKAFDMAEILSKNIVDDLRKELKNKESPIIVVDENVVIDGYHRSIAWFKNGNDKIKVVDLSKIEN